MRFLNVWRHAYAARGAPCGPTICGSGRRGRMRWEVPVCWGASGRAQWRGCRELLIGAGAGAVARLPLWGLPRLRAVLVGARGKSPVRLVFSQRALPKMHSTPAI